MRALRPLGVVLCLTLATPVFADEPLSLVVARAATYASRYQESLSLVVAEERYQQEVRYPAPPQSRARDMVSRTTLQSDFLIVRSPSGDWVPFRDVFARDGTPVRDRQERLSALFLDSPGTAFEQARRIVEESARYNVGTLDRTTNVPTLALLFLTDAHRSRMEFEFDGAASSGVRVVRFREVRTPTYIKTTNNRDLPVSGRYWIEEASGQVVRTELRASDDALDAHITVSYRMDEAAGLLVPDRMDEQYLQKNDRSEIRGNAVYTRYRRFQVTTSDDLSK